MKCTRLSHSSSSAYQDCPKKWDLRYNQKYYSKTTSSALKFGTALDDAIEVYLETKCIDKAKRRLVEIWTEQDIGGNKTFLPTTTKMVYSNADFDYDLLTEEQIDHIKDTYKLESVKDEYKSLKNLKDAIGYAYMKKSKKEIFNYINWHSMLSKGRLMLLEAIRILDDNVEKVYGTQIKIELKNDDGDTVIGYTDFVVKWKGYDKPVILDLKTSARRYEDTSVKTSTQLSLYLNALTDEYDNTRYAGYMVLHKTIKKNKKKICSVCGFDGTGGRHKTCNNTINDSRCGGAWNETIDPQVTTQIIIDEIPERLENMVLDNFNEVNKAVKANIFPRNFDACMKPWGPCDYYDICHSGDFSKVYKKENK